MKNTRFIIMADGKGNRWEGSKPKHLIEVDNEPLIQRTIRLLGDEDIIISSHNNYNFAPRYEPNDNIFEIDRFYSNREIWTNDTCFIYGDVYYTENAIKKIKDPIKNIAFYGRRKKNKLKKYGEMFAIRVINPFDQFKLVLEVLRDKEKKGLVRGLGWDVFKLYNRRNFVELDEMCEDFDKIEDLVKWADFYEKRISF